MHLRRVAPLILICEVGGCRKGILFATEGPWTVMGHRSFVRYGENNACKTGPLIRLI